MKDSSGDIWLYCKGADSAVMPLITKGETRKTNAHVVDFSMVRYPVYDNRKTKATAETKNLAILILFCFLSLQLYFTLQKLLETLYDFQRGLRTLVVAYKKMNQSEYENLMHNVEQARQIIGAERETRITRAYNLMESGLTLLGVTAVEDRLQDKVQETLECLRVAGIKVSSLPLCRLPKKSFTIRVAYLRFCFINHMYLPALKIIF